MRSFRAAFGVLIVLVITFALPADAQQYCDYWRCLRSPDTAECKWYLGTGAGRTRGTSCQVVSQCMWDYDAILGWTMRCSYDCEITQCYDV